jgi:predicted DNA-binding helix-hairpin-helix protein
MLVGEHQAISGRMGSSEQQGICIAYSIPHQRILYKYFHATQICFYDVAKYSLLMCKIFCHIDKAPISKHELLSFGGIYG